MIRELPSDKEHKSVFWDQSKDIKCKNKIYVVKIKWNDQNNRTHTMDLHCAKFENLYPVVH